MGRGSSFSALIHGIRRRIPPIARASAGRALRADGDRALIAVDTNILVYAHREELEQHAAALSRLRELAEGQEPWALPVFCAAEFVRVVTHPRLFEPPSTLHQALAALDAVLAAPTLRLLFPESRFMTLFQECLTDGDARGNLVFDAQIAALCLEHGATRLLTLDRDFARFPRLRPIGLEQ